MDKKLALAALAALAVGFFAGKGLSGGASKAELNNARAAGCNTLAEALTGELITCVIRGENLVGQVQGVDAFDLDNKKPIGQ